MLQNLNLKENFSVVYLRMKTDKVGFFVVIKESALALEKQNIKVANITSKILAITA